MDGESGFSLFSPAETSYSLEDGDAPKTPLFTDDVERDVFLHHFNPDPNHLPSYQFGEGQNLNEFGSETSETLYFLASPIPPLCVLSSTQQIPPQSRLPSSLRALDGITIEDNPDLIIIDPFDSSFTAANADRITHAPLLVQTSFTEACGYSSRFPNGHLLNPSFVRAYDLGDELGSGGYGFVMTAYNRAQNREVAVKFIIKERVSEHSWTEDEVFGRLPTEILLLSLIDHENIVKCLDLFEDELYFYLVRKNHCQRCSINPSVRLHQQIQELHGSPWKKLLDVLPSQARSLVADESSSPPLLSPSSSEDSMVDFSPTTPLQPSDLKLVQHVQIRGTETPLYHISKQEFESLSPEQLHQNEHAFQRIHCSKFSRRPSHDLFECIEQTPNKCLSEDQARYIFAQVVEAAFYLDSQGITHRDIKDENLVIDKDLKVIHACQP